MARRVPRLLPEFNESFFKQNLKDLEQKLLTKKDQEAEILYQRIVLGLITPNPKLTEIKYRQFYEETLQFYDKMPASIDVEYLMSEFYSLPTYLQSTKVRFVNKSLYLLSSADSFIC